MRPRLLRSFLDTLEHEDDLVCHVDAYDVILLEPVEELVTRYQSMAGNGAVVIRADENPGLGVRLSGCSACGASGDGNGVWEMQRAAGRQCRPLHGHRRRRATVL